jgi:hypothetical protein
VVVVVVTFMGSRTMTEPCPADCQNCNLEDKPCKSCNEACLNCQDKFDPEFVKPAENERKKILDLLIANKVMRIDALGLLCFVNCDNLKVQYSHIFDDIIKGETK